MNSTTSRDGTRIAYERSGDGPPLVLVDGALCYRASGPSRPLAKELAAHYTVLTYDRRGRGDSGNTEPYEIEREVEDIDALIREAGGSAFVYGISSGAALALEAAAHGLPIRALAAYEPPYMLAGDEEGLPTDFAARIRAAVAEGRLADAVEVFMEDVPPEVLEMMRQSPDWPSMVALANTLPYELEVVGDGPPPVDRLAAISVPILVLAGAASEPWLVNAADAVAAAVPDAVRITLDGQDHAVADDVLAPVLIDALAG